MIKKLLSALLIIAVCLTALATTGCTTTKQYLLTFRFVDDATGDTIAPDIVMELTVGEQYDISENERINGYVFAGDRSLFSGTAQGTATITLRYNKIVKYTVTVNYLCVDDGTVVAEAWSETLDSGSTYNLADRLQPAIDGYTYISNNAESMRGVLTEDVTVTSLYKKNTAPSETEPGTWRQQEISQFKIYVLDLLATVNQNDAEAVIKSLWNMNALLFDTNNHTAVFSSQKDDPEGYSEFRDYEALARALLTERARTEYEKTDLFKRSGGKYYRQTGLVSGRTWTTSYESSRLLEQTDATLTYLVTAEMPSWDSSPLPGIISPDVIYYDARITIAKENGRWLVDAYDWSFFPSMTRRDIRWSIFDQTQYDDEEMLLDNLLALTSLVYARNYDFVDPDDILSKDDKDYAAIINYEQLMGLLFTPRGREQYEEQGTTIVMDEKRYRIIDFEALNGVPLVNRGFEIVERSDTQMSVRYDCGSSGFARLKLVKTDGRWLVDMVTYPAT